MSTRLQATQRALIVATSALLAPAPATAFSGDSVECDLDYCRIHVTDQLTFEAAFDQVRDSGDRIDVSGDLTVYGPGMELELDWAELVFKRREDGAPVPFELYGTASVPLPNIPMLSGSDGDGAPRAVIGLASRDTLRSLLEEDDYPLPLAENPLDPDGDPNALIEPAYLFVHYAQAPKVEFPLTAWLKPEDQQEENAGDGLSFALPAEASMTVIVDPAEPYVFVSSQVGTMLVDALGEEMANARRDAEAADQSSRDRAGPDGHSDNGDSQFDVGLPQLNELAFSAAGGIPFEPRSAWGLPSDFGSFKGHLHVDAKIPLYKFIELDGTLVTYIGENGFEQGGNGNVNVDLELIPGLPSLSFPLGDASAGLRIVDGDLVVYFSGLNSPDYSFLPDFVPVAPMNATRVAGVIDTAKPGQSMIRAHGRFAYDMSSFRRLTGIDLNDLEVGNAELKLSENGVWLKGSTRQSLHPSIELGGRVDVEIYFSVKNPARSFANLSGEMAVAGVGLKPVMLRLDADGLMVEGRFVTPISEVRMFGEIGPAGPQLEGSTSVVLSASQLTGAIDKLRAGVVSAQDKVDALLRDVERNRELVREERVRNAVRLVEAQGGVERAQDRIADLDAVIRDYRRAIDGYRADIRAKYRWYKRQSGWKRAWAWARYASYRAGRSAKIAWRNSQIASVKVALGTAKVALTVAKEFLKGVEAAITVMPVDLDPRVAVPLAALGSARIALEAAELALPDLPEIPAELRAHIAMELGMTGLGGKLSADFNGHRLTGGTLRFGKSPEACIDVPVIGSLCAPF